MSIDKLTLNPSVPVSGFDIGFACQNEMDITFCSGDQQISMGALLKILRHLSPDHFDYCIAEMNK